MTRAGRAGRAGIGSWIVGLAVALPATAFAEQAYTTTAVNLRAGPDTDYPLVRWVPESTAVEVHGCLADYRWCDVEVYGDRGWMSASYLVYPYQSSTVPIVTYGAVIGLPLVGFTFDSYWDNHYSHRPWYHDRQRWAQRYRPEYNPPSYRPPQYYPPGNRPQYRPPANRPPEYYPPAARPPQYRPPQVQAQPQPMRPPPDRQPTYRSNPRPQQPNYRPEGTMPPVQSRPPATARPPSPPPMSNRPTPGRSPQGLHNDAGERGGMNTGNY